MNVKDRAKKAVAHVKEISNRSDVHCESGRWWSWEQLETILLHEITDALAEGVDHVIREGITKLVETIEAEPLAVREPAESVQIGRLQVVDEISHILRLVR